MLELREKLGKKNTPHKEVQSNLFILKKAKKKLKLLDLVWSRIRSAMEIALGFDEIQIHNFSMVREKGLEPPRRKAPDPKSGASANSATPACPFDKIYNIIV